MPDNQLEVIFKQVTDHAFNRLTPQQRQTTNLYLDRRVYQKGEKLGSQSRQIVIEKPSLLVFADDHPLANFAHDCRYLLYDPETGAFDREIPARLPPYLGKAPATLTAIHQPVSVQPNPGIYTVQPMLRCPVLRPVGNRYAILYAGMCGNRHLNDLEFCFRMLIDRYGFDPKNIYALVYDGTLNTTDGVPPVWPGNSTAYRIKVTGPGNRTGFQGAFNDLKTRIKPGDLLFIHTNNHGDNVGGQSLLYAYPNWSEYFANDFCADLKTLPKYKSLIVMMEQCHSGGFNAPVLSASTAANTSIASAAIATQNSWATPDGNWDSFAHDWIAAEMGHNPNGAALAFNPDTDGDGVIEAEEAFNYANAIKNPSDTPNYSESSEAGGDITLGQQYAIWWWWCWLVKPIIEKYYPVYPAPPDPEFWLKVHSVTPDLQQLVTARLDAVAADVRKDLGPKIEAAVAAAFKAR
ncbi:MAG TPA: C13 family peptidase [Bryobacteraceae bacterium]|nr:C13 family peptidase [Bryobacteraceae bacterium]